MLATSDYVERRSLGGSGLWPARRPKLHGLDIELTERCNNACQHCYINLPAGDQQAASRELATAEWQGIFRQAAELGALSLRLTGGEPLLRDDFAELYLFARRLGLKVTLYTNARLITPELAELFARVPPLERIEITVYGMHPESYDAAACAPGAYAEFRRGVDLLLECGVPFLVKGALLPPNQSEMDEFEAWAATLPGMQGRRPGYAMLFDLRGRRDSPARDRLIRRLRLTPKQVLGVLARDEAGYRRDQAAFCSRFIGPAGARLFSCGAGVAGSADAYGRYQPCMLLRDPELSYDLRQGSLQAALETFFPQVRELEATNPEYLERCARCFLHGLCEQCPAKSWSEHGSLDTPVEYLCQVAHAQARWLGLLDEGERAWEVVDWRARLDRLNHENRKE
jgi:radical SAM protein with 4Fe4S-binding SPASM domain